MNAVDDAAEFARALIKRDIPAPLMRACGCISCMNTTAAFFLSTLLLAAAAAGAKDERLIPIDDFSIIVHVNDRPPVAGRWEGLRVTVSVFRGGEEPVGSTITRVSCPGISAPYRTLEEEDVAVFQKACAAALQGQDFREEVRMSMGRTVYEVVTVDGKKRVSLQRGGTVLLAPEEGARLKESLAQAAAAVAWYQKLLSERTLPAKTAAAHPPVAADYFLSSKLGEVHAEGLDYEVAVTHHREPYQVEHALRYIRLGGFESTVSGPWVEDMLGEVARALRAVAKGQKFEVTSTRNRSGDGYGVRANLTTQQADVEFDAGSDFGKQSRVQGAFTADQLAAILKIAAGGEAREKWFAEHEAWFFERP
jgi:hypothetical protein